MLAPPRRLSLILPSGHANMPPRIQPSGRLGWRLAGGKALCHRSGAPTICGGAHEATDHVGAAPPAKPDSTVGPRQQAVPNPTRRPAELAHCRRQSLTAPFRGANNCGGAHEATDHVGAAPPAKPDSTVGPRQQVAPNSTRRRAELAPSTRQIFMAPSGGANNLWRSPRGGRPCWRCPAG